MLFPRGRIARGNRRHGREDRQREGSALSIRLNVKQRADAVGTFRFVSVFLMESLARWIPLTPEMEVKMLLARQVWRMAQEADRMGRRARELRAPLHYSRPPRAEFLAALKRMAAVTDTID